MKIYLDTGNIEEIKEAVKTGLIDGVTTNPSLIAKEGKDFESSLKEIITILKEYKYDFTVSAEVTDTKNADSMIKQGRELSKIDSHILVKVPLTVEGLKAVGKLSEEGVNCNVTLCFSLNQALLAAKAGAWCVSPFIGRLEDEGHDGEELLRDMRKVYDNYGFKTKILGASIRSCEHVFEASKIGVDIVTIPYSIFKKLFYNPLTDIGLEKFAQDWDTYKKNRK